MLTTSSSSCVRCLTTGLIVLGAAWSGRGAPAGSGRFAVDDYFRIQRVTELALSSSGERLAYVVDSPKLDENRTVRAVYVSGVERGARAQRLDPLVGAHDLAWVPRNDELAYLAPEKGLTSVYCYSEHSARVTRATSNLDSVIRFRLAADGANLAYETETAADPAQALYQRFHNGHTGIVADSDTLSIHDFLNPNWAQVNGQRPLQRQLWIKNRGADSPARPVTVPGVVSEFFWSPDSTQLSVVYIAADAPQSATRPSHTSLGIVEVATGRFSPLLTGRSPAGQQPGIWYSGGEWLPQGNRLLARRYIQSDPTVSPEFPDWTVVVASALGTPEWHPAETYHARYFPRGDADLLVENTVRARSSLFRWTPQGTEPSEIVSGLNGSSSLFAFGPKSGSAVFVNESLTRPPEIFVRSGDGQPAWQLTQLNSPLATGASVKASEVTWRSADGTIASGWLMMPTQAGQHGPWPMVTLIHGGPTFPFPDAFAPYFYYWPFPLDAYVAHGMAVFVPNYRGTSTFGRKYQGPDDSGQAGIEDIMSGVKKLIADGVADAGRLGISGQSYGAWLGPRALTLMPIFKASSFAEGTANQGANYELQDGLSNRELGDVANRADLYDNPQRYVELSPDLHFSKVKSANLFEAGAWSQAVEMLSFAKASRHFGLPTEYVIYPRTAHNPNSLQIQQESAARNLDWFRFWLKGELDADPAKAEQYARWARARSH